MRGAEGGGDRPGDHPLPVTPTGRIAGGRLSSSAVYRVLRERLGQTGVATRSPHDFRRTFVGDLPGAGIDLATVQQRAGHASVTTTARYNRRGEAAKRKAVEVLHFPYGGRPAADERRDGEPE